MNAVLHELIPIFPEIFLAIIGLWLVLTALFSKTNPAQSTNLLTIASFLGALAIILTHSSDHQTVWNGLLTISFYTQMAKCLVLVSALLVLSLTSGWLKEEENQRFEYPILALFSVTGMLLLLSANDLITFYLSAELMSLPLYLLAAIDRDSSRSTEAGIKYFVLGSLASGMMLFGMSLVYGFTGTTNFDVLHNAFVDARAGGAAFVLPGVMIGILLILTGLFFKASAAPFHMWTPDVYEGVPTPVTAFFAAVPKVAVLAFFARLMLQPFGDLLGIWQQIIVVVSALTMLVGALGALAQTNIKRLLAYSSIGHVGYVLIGIAAGTTGGLKAVLIYLALYLFMAAGTFGLVLFMKRDGKSVETISELGGLGRTHPRMAFAFAVMLFSMAGIPPLAGFFAKLYIFLAAMQAGLVVLAVIGVLTSVIACFYYIKIVKIMYFDDKRPAFDQDPAPAMRLAVGLCVFVILFYIVLPGPLIDAAARAAESVFM